MRYFHRTTLGLSLVVATLALLCSAIAAAAQDSVSSAPAVEEASPGDLADNGFAIEAALDTMGLGDMWRETTALGDVTGHLMVEYPGPNSQSVVAAMLTTLDELESAESLRASTTVELRKSASLLGHIADHIARLDRQLVDDQVGLETTSEFIQTVAINMFSNNGSVSDEAAALAHPDLLLTRRADEFTAAALENLMDQRNRLTAELETVHDELPTAIQGQAAARAAYATLKAVIADLPDAITELHDKVVEMLPKAAEMFAASEVPDEPGLSLRALDAYFNAQFWMDEMQPECGITWQTIGAIGLVESRHGTHGGNRLLPDGRTQFPIVGATLDGTGDDNFGQTVAVVADTDGGVYDGDPLNDRAVGPMQFIPETWRQWAVDIDGDGRRDPNDMDDAAVATARYLCANGQMRSTAAWDDAIFTYNQSRRYVDSVRVAYHQLDDAVAAATVEPPAEAIVSQ